MQMTHAAFVEAEKLATDRFLKQHPMVRDSFHSLIGDFYIGAILTGYFSARLAKMPQLPPIFLWDTEIPHPNEHTAVAWYLTLENPIELLGSGYRRRSYGVAAPECIDPYYWSAQDDGPTGSLRESYELGNPGSFSKFLPQDFRKKLMESQRNQLPPLYHRDQHLESTLLHAVDNRPDILDSELRSLVSMRTALMWQVATPPRMPMTVVAMDIRGSGLRPWTAHGLIVRPPKESVKWGKFPIRLAQGLEDPVLGSVPTATPPLWIGFTYTGGEAKAFMDSYFKVRSAALDQLRNPEIHPGVHQESWADTLRRKGLFINDESDAGQTSITTTKSGVQIKGLDGINLSDLFN